MTSFGLSRSHFRSPSLPYTHTLNTLFLLMFFGLFLSLLSLDISLSLFVSSFLPFSFFRLKNLVFASTSIFNENITPYTTQENFELTSKLFLEAEWNAFINARIIIIRWVESLKSCWGSITALCVLLRAIEYGSILFEN